MRGRRHHILALIVALSPIAALAADPIPGPINARVEDGLLWLEPEDFPEMG